MTAKIKYDFFSRDLDVLEKRFFAVVLETSEHETSDKNVTVLYKRGIYCFDTKKERNLFTMRCNDDKDETIAFSFNKKR